MSSTTAVHDPEPTTATSPATGGTSRVLDVAAALARFGLALMWIYSGYTKIGAHLDVTKSIEAYQIFTPYWSDLLARVIGPLELAGGLLLLLGIHTKGTPPSAPVPAPLMRTNDCENTLGYVSMGASALNLRFDDAPPLLLPPAPPVDVADFGALL